MNETARPRVLDAADMDALVAALGSATAEEMARYFHPYANIFPLMDAAEQDALGERMAAGGQREPCVILDGLLLDGRNRAIQARKRGLTLRVRPYDPRPDKDGPDPLAYVEDLNLQRRHLTASQRAYAAAEAETLRHGGSRRRDDQAANLHLDLDEATGQRPEPPTRAEMGDRFKVSERLIADAATVRDAGIEAVQKAVKGGDIAADAGAALTALTPDKQADFIASLPRDEHGKLTSEAKKKVRSLAKELRTEETAAKKAKRAQREAELGGKIAVLPDEKQGFIAADPEWKFKPFSEETGMDRAPDNHYPTSEDDAIAERRRLIDSVAADDSVLGLWTTDLARGIDTMRQWGFVFRSYFVWLKNLVEVELTAEQKASGFGDARVFVYSGAQGLGYWNRDEDEILLIGTRGNPICPAMGEQGSSVWYELKREHSEKPECFYAWVDKHFAHTPRIEFNARRRRPGWQAWGNEVKSAPREIAALEREALARGLINERGMVAATSSASVAFGFVTEAEWRDLIARDKPKPEIMNGAGPAVDGDQADLDTALADPFCADMAGRATPFQVSKVFNETTASAVTPPFDDGQLDIPAFLRRQA